MARELIAEAVARQEALGHPAVWAVEQEKLIQSVQTAVAFDVEHSLVERRYPALFEFSFEESLGVSVATETPNDSSNENSNNAGYRRSTKLCSTSNATAV